MKPCKSGEFKDFRSGSGCQAKLQQFVLYSIFINAAKTSSSIGGGMTLPQAASSISRLRFPVFAEDVDNIKYQRTCAR